MYIIPTANSTQNFWISHMYTYLVIVEHLGERTLLSQLVTQNRMPNEPQRESIGQSTPKNASHGLLFTGSAFSDVHTVKVRMTRKVTDISGSAFTPGNLVNFRFGMI